MRRAAIGSTAPCRADFGPMRSSPVGTGRSAGSCFCGRAGGRPHLPRPPMRAPGDTLLTLLPSPWHLAAVPDRRDRHARRRLHLQRHRRRGHRCRRSSARARGRLPSGQVSRRQAWIFLILQALVGLAVLLQFNSFAVLLGIVSLAVVADLPVHEAHHQLAAIRSRPCLFLGRADGLGRRLRRSRCAGRAALSPARCCG